MKFLKVNAKVLLILCLFSGILFLSTGCGSNDNDDDKEPEIGQKENNTNKENKEGNSNNTGNSVVNSNNTTLDNNVDYSVWIANTTINTDKGQRSYKVIWGDTLWLISTAWEVPYQQIATYNNIPNPDLIYVDQIIYNPLFK